MAPEAVKCLFHTIKEFIERLHNIRGPEGLLVVLGHEAVEALEELLDVIEVALALGINDGIPGL